jgi:hypothetical protein
MPPKRKDGATTANAGRVPKRSKPTFRAPTTTTVPDTTISQAASSSRNRIVTLRTSATGRRGYRTQDVVSNPESNPDSDSSAPSNFIDPLPVEDATDIGIEGLNTDTDTPAVVGAKSRSKQKNTTAVR